MSEGDRAATVRAPWSSWLRLCVPLATALFHATTARGYGVFRDELYYYACGQHLAWGYVDHPPMVALFAALSGALFGSSYVALRVLVALAAGGAVWLAGTTAARFGGGSWAELAAQASTALAPVLVALFATYSMNGLDVLIWSGLFALAAHLVDGAPPRLWLSFGLLAGLALETKVSGLYLGSGLAVGLLAARRWDLLSERLLWWGGALTTALFVPYLTWQALHGFPTLEFLENARSSKIAVLSPQEFIAAQASQAGPVLALFALAGLAWLLAAPRARPFRSLGWAAVSVLGLLAFSTAKPYYFAPVWALLFPAGAVAVESWTVGRLQRSLRASVLLLIASTALFAPLAKPLLPVEHYLRYAAALGIEAASDENQALGRLPQYFADMHGWRELASSVARVVATLTPEERAHVCVVAQNYGEAGAIDFYRAELNLPPAISGHNNYWFWGPGDCSGEILLILGEQREDHSDDFETVELGGVHHCVDCMPYENELAIWIARKLNVPIAEAWSGARRFH
ncbi:MAG: glycosyltransferase family 39 protein [Thermoanaerobaculia bacterium]